MVGQLPPGDKVFNPIPSPPSQPTTGGVGLGANSYFPTSPISTKYDFSYEKVKGAMIDNMAQAAADFAVKTSPAPNGVTSEKLKSLLLSTKQFTSEMTKLFDEIDYALKYGYTFTSSSSYDNIKIGFQSYIHGWAAASSGLAGGTFAKANLLNISMTDMVTQPSGILYGFKTAYAIYDVGWAANNLWYQSPGKDVIFFNNAASGTVSAAAGDDLVFFNYDGATALDAAGNDVYIFAGGINTLEMGAKRQSFKIEAAGEKITITNAFGEKDVAYGVDRLNFSDGTLAFDADGNAGMAYRLYQATFNRKPDASGVSFWINELDKGGVTLSTMAKLMIGSNEFQSKYGSVSNSKFVSLVYENVLHRTQDATGAAFWDGQLANGMSRDALLLHFSESPENVKAVSSDLNAGIFLL